MYSCCGVPWTCKCTSRCHVLGQSSRTFRESKGCLRSQRPGCMRIAAEEQNEAQAPSRILARHLLVDSLQVLKRIFWPICWVYIAQSGFLFVIERCTQRLTNACFLVVNGSNYSASQIGSLWWLSVDPAITDFSTGYSYISFALACLSYPATAAVSCIALVALFRIASEARDGKVSKLSAPTAAVLPARVRPSSHPPTPPFEAPPESLPADTSSESGPSGRDGKHTHPEDKQSPHSSSIPVGSSGDSASPTSKDAESSQPPVQTGMPPPQTLPNSTGNPAVASSVPERAPRQDSLLAAAQAAYSLLADDSDSGSDSAVGGSQGVVGAAQQISTDTISAGTGDAGDKSAPSKQRLPPPPPGSAGGAAATAASGAAGGGAAAAVEGTAAGRGGGRDKGRKARKARLWSVQKAMATVSAVMREDFGRVFWTYLLVSCFESVILLASTIFVTLPLTIPRLLNVQLAVPVAAMEGSTGLEAMRESKARMHGYRRTAALMLGLVFVLQKALPPVSAILISTLPHKVIVQVPEAVVAVLMVGQVALFAASQLKGLVALMIYTHTANAQPQTAAAL